MGKRFESRKFACAQGSDSPPVPLSSATVSSARRGLTVLKRGGTSEIEIIPKKLLGKNKCHGVPPLYVLFHSPFGRIETARREGDSPVVIPMEGVSPR